MVKTPQLGTMCNIFFTQFQYNFISVLFLFLGALPSMAQDEITRSELLKRHIVAIYSDNGELLGSGASVSATGLILTAKHILEQRVSGLRALSYRMSVNIRSQRDAKFRSARLVATHPHMDLAILSAPQGELIPPLLIATTATVVDEDWFAIGHPKRTGAHSQELFVARSGQWSSVQLNDGWYVIDEGFDTGMSGGPVIVGDRIVGIVGHASTRTFVVPIHESLDFFDLLGFSTSEGGAMRQQDHVGILAGKVQNYEKILSDIQVDRRWTCTLNTNWSQALDSIPSELTLILRGEKRLRSQPDLSARIGMDMKAEILATGQQPFEVKGDGVEWVNADSNEVKFENIVSDLKYGVQGENYDLVSLDNLNFRFSISRISGDGFIRDNPKPYTICCSFPAKGATESIQIYGGRQEAGLCNPDIFPGSRGDDDETPN